MAEEAAAAHKRDPNRTVESGVTELICGLLTLDPAIRLTAAAALQLDYLSAQQHHAIAVSLPVDDEDDGMQYACSHCKCI
jgi:biotin carboxylase